MHEPIDERLCPDQLYAENKQKTDQDRAASRSGSSTYRSSLICLGISLIFRVQ
ncbi:hypothetical protein Scep_019849 [Stephania cephalantha]|uniref:Uncharacterized protein n=1 Tax=Stephania cephalantha TaxID=152367 RepID=A0AAP0NNQ0_9MAGN